MHSFRLSTSTRLLALLGLAATLALPQNLSISGSVSDGSKVVADAQVTLRTPSGKISASSTSGSGTFQFDGLTPGSYELAVSRSGFKAVSQQLSLTAESRTVEMTLEVGGLATSIDVNDVADRGTASGMAISNRELPNYVVSIGQRILQEQGINDLATALENVSGVITQTQYGVYDWYTISGITQQSGNDFLYVDGMTLTGNRSATQLNNIEEVQVLKGPNSILYGGAGAGQGGMINLIRKKPTALRTYDIQYRIGRWGLQEVTGASTGSMFGLKRLLYRVDGSFSHRDGWRDNGANRFNMSPSLTWLITDKMRVTTNQGFIRDRYLLDVGLPVTILGRQGVPFDRKINPAGDFQLSRDWQNQIIYTWNITNRLIFTNSFFTRVNRDQYLDAESIGYLPATDEITRAYLYYQHNRRPKQNQADLQGYYILGGMQHHFLARYEYQDQYNFTYRTGNAPGTSNALSIPLPNVPVTRFIDGTWVDSAPTYTNFPITRVDQNTTQYKNGIVLQDQVNPVKWLGFNFTISRRSFRRQTRNDAYDNGRFVSFGPEISITNETKNNYRAGLSLIPQQNWGLFRGFQPYFSYNSSFNPQFQIQASGLPLDPVINESFEAGNKWRGLGGKLDILTAFRRIEDKNRVINLGNMIFEQVGKTTTYSADLDIEGNVGKGYWVLANYAYADSVIDDFRANGTPEPNGGRRFAQAPKHTSRIWLTKRIDLGEGTRLHFSLGGRYVSRYYANNANTNLVPGRTTFDGAVGFTRNRYDISVNLTNLLNKERYFTSQINGGGLLTPGQPFAATVTFRYRFQ